MKKWQIFFKATQEVIGQDDDGDVMGYILGPDDLVVSLPQVIEIITVGNVHCIMYRTDNTAIAASVRTWSEFLGFGYVDMIWRIALGLGPAGGPTLADIKHLTGAHWDTGGEGHFGSIQDWTAAGKPPNVWFGPLVEIMGTKMQ